MFRRNWVARVAVAAAVLILVAGDTYHGRPRVAVAYPERPMATLGTQFSPPPEPTIEEPDWPVIDAAPAWRVDLPEDLTEYDLRELVPTPDGYLVRTRDRLLALDAEGETRWQVPGSSPLDPPLLQTAVVSEDLVVVGQEHDPTDEQWPGQDLITVHDPATGEALWEEDEASFWSVVGGTIYLSICNGGQDGEIGDCELEARVLRSNRPRWRIPTYASVQVVGGGESYLVLESYPTGYDSRTITVVDARSGRRLAAGFDGFHGARLTADTLVREEGGDENPADGCTSELTGFDLEGGGEAWRFVSRTRKEADGAYCAGLPDSSFGDRYALTDRDGHAVVLDPATGEVEWTGPEPGFGLIATEDLVLVLEETGAEPELVRYDRPSGQERWRAPAPPGVGSPEPVLFDETILVHRESGDVLFGYDLGTGAFWSYQDRDSWERWLIGSRWVAICDARTCRGYDVR